jgi:rubrerythrin
MSEAEALLYAVRAHVDSEAGAKAAYRRLLLLTQDSAVRTVLEEIVTDEQQHHALFGKLGDLFEAELTGRPGQAEQQAPKRRGGTEEQRLLRTLIEDERDSARKLRKLAGEHKSTHGGLVAELLLAMAHDSEKHARLLRFVSRRLFGPT